MKKVEQATSLEKEASIGFIGFTIFDAIHLVVAVAILIFAYSSDTIEEIEAAASTVELGFVVLLLMFEISLVKRTGHASSVRRNYGYCFLLAAMSVFIPSSFNIPELIYGEWGVKESTPALITASLDVAFAFIAVFFFVFAQIVDEHREGGLDWRKLILIGNIFFVLAALSGVAFSICEEMLPTWVRVFKIIGNCAPLFPGFITFWRLARSHEKTDLY